MQGERHNLERLLQSAYDLQQRQLALSGMEVSKREKSSERTRLSWGDSIGALALLLGVYLVIVIPPLLLKALLLVGVSLGFFYFATHSHWTHGWRKGWQYATASGIVAILIAVGIPQFISQWKSEHPKAAPTVFQSPIMPSTNPAIPPQNNGPTFSNIQVDGFGTGVVNHEGQLNFKDSKIHDNGVGIDNQNSGAQINFDRTEISGNKTGIINRGSTKPQKPKRP